MEMCLYCKSYKDKWAPNLSSKSKADIDIYLWLAIVLRWVVTSFLFPRIPVCSCFCHMYVPRNNMHHFQDRSYTQLIGLFYVLFFLSAWLHAKDLLEIRTGRVTNCKCHVVDHLPNQKFMGNTWKVCLLCEVC